MLVHDLDLFRLELSRLEQDGVGDADLADVVQLGGLLEHVEPLALPAQFASDEPRVLAHAQHVPPRVVIAELGCAGQAVDHLLPRAGQLGRPPQDFRLQLVRILLHVVVMAFDRQHVVQAGG